VTLSGACEVAGRSRVLSPIVPGWEETRAVLRMVEIMGRGGCGTS